MTTVAVTVAVTGASGFIGGHLLRALIGAGFDVRALARRLPPPGSTSPITWIQGDLDDAVALGRLLDRADLVIHGAGAIKALSRADFFAVNGEGTERLAKLAAAQATPPRFIHLSSLAARAPHLSGYAASKAAGEAAVLRLCGKLPVAILRPPAVYGPGDAESLRIFQMAARGWLAVPAVDGARLSLAHVDDVVAAVLATARLQSFPDQPVEFDDGASHGHSWPEIAQAASDALGRPVRSFRIPPAILYAAGAAASLGALVSRRPSVLSWDKVGEVLHPDWVAAGPRLPGYQPRWTLREGFQNAAEWAASRGLLRLLRRS